MTFIDLNTSSLRPVIRLVSNLVHYGHPGVVHSVMVGGTFILRDRRMLTVDEPAVLRLAQAATQRVWERMIAANPDIARPDGELQWLEE